MVEPIRILKTNPPQHSHHHKSNRQKASTSCTQIWHLYVRPIYQHSHFHKSNRQRASISCTQIWPLYVRPIYQHSHHHKSNRQKASTSCTQIWHLSMYDPYTSTHTIIRVTAKKRQHLAPRLGTSI